MKIKGFPGLSIQQSLVTAHGRVLQHNKYTVLNTKVGLHDSSKTISMHMLLIVGHRGLIKGLGLASLDLWPVLRPPPSHCLAFMIFINSTYIPGCNDEE